MNPRHVLVLGGGPDAEREVSLESSRCVAEALATLPGYTVHREIIDAIDLASLRALPGDIIFPVLHGPFGEGGPLQDLMEQDGRPYVGCRPFAACAAMDKVGSKLAAMAVGVPTTPARVFNPRDTACPLPLPVVLKPIHEGSSVGVHICTTPAHWAAAVAAATADMHTHPHRSYMVEGAILGGSELTVGVLDGTPLAPIRIRPKSEFYDYHAKYHSDDTKYDVDPPLAPGLKETLQHHAAALARAIGVRHLCRVDFLQSREGEPWLLEVNTMPGFTGHSLLPMAAAHAGLPFAALTQRLVECAVRDSAVPAVARP
ncbi:MAG: D-alanine--D-alanine ligase [Phycisphaerales bacterium]